MPSGQASPLCAQASAWCGPSPQTKAGFLGCESLSLRRDAKHPPAHRLTRLCGRLLTAAGGDQRLDHCQEGQVALQRSSAEPAHSQPRPGRRFS